jgi:hypothetical protein
VTGAAVRVDEHPGDLRGDVGDQRRAAGGGEGDEPVQQLAEAAQGLLGHLPAGDQVLPGGQDGRDKGGQGEVIGHQPPPLRPDNECLALAAAAVAVDGHAAARCHLHTSGANMHHREEVGEAAKMCVSLRPTARTRSATASAWAVVSSGSTSTASSRPKTSVVDTGAQVRAPPSGVRPGRASGIASDTMTS